MYPYFNEYLQENNKNRMTIFSVVFFVVFNIVKSHYLSAHFILIPIEIKIKDKQTTLLTINVYTKLK